MESQNDSMLFLGHSNECFYNMSSSTAVKSQQKRKNEQK